MAFDPSTGYCEECDDANAPFRYMPININWPRKAICDNCNVSYQKRLEIEATGKQCGGRCATRKSVKSYRKDDDVCIKCRTTRNCKGECGMVKPLKEFSGRQHICKKCKVTYVQERRKTKKETQNNGQTT